MQWSERLVCLKMGLQGGRRVVYENILTRHAHDGLIENQPQTATYLAASIDSLGLQDICTLHTTGASDYLAQCSQPFDIVFLDPPFAATALLEQAIALVCQRGLVRQHIYLEFDQQQESAVAALLSTFELSPSKTTKAGSTRSWLISAC